MDSLLASQDPVAIPRRDFERMLAFARTVYRLKDNPAYLARLEESMPPAARIRSPWPSVLMGFDFHLTPDGPKLIEINNNAGGLYVGEGRWLPQPAIPELPGCLEQRLLSMFPDSWRCIAILDEDIRSQFMYPEMCAYAALLRDQGREVHLVSPEDIRAADDGLYVQASRLDAIYNRHTDFYLQSPRMRPILEAYRQGLVFLNPHPRSYALIGDKARMVDWWTPGFLEGCLSKEDITLIRQMTPETHHLKAMPDVWEERKAWVFKPSARHGGKGVVLGRSMSRRRFESLDVEQTIVQRYVPPCQVQVEGREMKLDVRLFTHGERLIAVAGRVWRGQLTNFREPGSGWVGLRLV